MARRSLFAVATLAFGILGANAGPCRPSTTVTSVAETSSTAMAETSSTTLEASSTTVAESSSTTVVESSSTTLFETSTSLAESSSTTVAETSTTSEALDCDTTQTVANPSFDDDDDAWTGISNLRSTQEPHSGSHNLRFRFTSGGIESYTFSQSLTDLTGPYRLAYYYRVAGLSTWQGSAGFSCSIVPAVGTRRFNGENPYDGGPYSWTESTEVWTPTSPSGHVNQATLAFGVTCNGEFDELIIAIDDVTFTEIKCESLQT